MPDIEVADKPPQAQQVASIGPSPLPNAPDTGDQVDANAVAPTRIPSSGVLPVSFGSGPAMDYAKIEQNLTDHKSERSAVAKEKASVLDTSMPLDAALGNMPRSKLPDMGEMQQSPRMALRSSLEVFRNPMMWLGIAGSLLTRRPMMNAMAAATGMMEGFSQGDAERIKLEQEKFKHSVNQSDMQIKTELADYNSILSSNKPASDMLSELSVIASSHNDPLMLKYIRAGDLGSIQQLVGGRTKMQEQLHKGRETWDEWKAKEDYRAKERADRDAAKPQGGARTSRGTPEEINKVAEGIIDGTMPPDLKSFYGSKVPVEAALKDRGFNLVKAQQEQTAANRQIASLNGPQMTRFSGLAQSVINTIDEVKRLAKEMDQGGISYLNQAQLMEKIRLEGNSERGRLATRYITAVNTLKEEFANLAQGGYAPTESVWALANKQISEGYGAAQLTDAISEVQRLVRYRVNAIPNFNALGPNAPNRYTGKGGQSEPVKVGTPEEAEKLAPGTRYQTPGGEIYTR